MISIFINARILNNTAIKVPAFLFHSKASEACAPNKSIKESPDSKDPNMPIITENPYKKEKQLCILCKLNIEPDYKNVRLLSQFQSRFTGRIYGKHITGLCKHKQKLVEIEIKKAQAVGLMGYMTKDLKFVNDPKLFNPDFPFRPHKY